MARIATLLGTGGRPLGLAQIIRKTKTTTRIRRSTTNGRTWNRDEQTVATDRILEDDGQLWKQHSRNPGYATWIGLNGHPAGHLSIQRVYKHITKATVYHGDNTWSQVEDFPSKDILFDGGAAAGWRTPDELRAVTAPSTGSTGADLVDVSPAPSVPADVSAGGEDKPRGITPGKTSQGQRISYIRVSTAEQNLARQREAIGQVDKEFQDKISARSRADRQGLEDCIDYLRDHDQLIVASIDRLARSLVDLQGLIDQITTKGASVVFLKESLTFSPESSDPRATLMLGILGSFAEFERSIIKERQAEGIALAKKAGKYKGRKRALTSDQVSEAKQRVAAGEKKAVIARDLGIGRATLYRALAD